MHLQAHEQPKTQWINPLIVHIGLMIHNFLTLTFYRELVRAWHREFWKYKVVKEKTKSSTVFKNSNEKKMHEITETVP